MDDKDLEQFRDIISAVKKDAEKIEAPKSVLLSVLNKVNYKKQKEESRPSLFIEYINQLNTFMNRQYVTAVVILALVATGGVYWYNQNPAVAPGTEYVPAQNNNQVEKATSEALTADVATEMASLDQDMADLSDLNLASNDAELDALNQDLASLDSI